jgi:flagellar basal-body rod protein FlgB
MGYILLHNPLKYIVFCILIRQRRRKYAFSVELKEVDITYKDGGAMDLINKPAMNLMERSLDASSLRQKVISNNIANADTPYFKRSDVQFEELLNSELTKQSSLQGYRTDPRHFVIGKSDISVSPEILTDVNSTMNNNLNNVDIDYEMSLMAKNQLKYNTLLQEMNTQFRQLRTVIGGK